MFAGNLVMVGLRDEQTRSTLCEGFMGAELHGFSHIIMRSRMIGCFEEELSGDVSSR